MGETVGFPHEGVDCRGARASPQARDRARARARHAWPLCHRLRERRLLDLLRARPHRRLRARADPARLRDRRRDLRRDGRDVRRGNGAVPGGRRIGELRAARVRRARQLRRGLGADARVHRHRRRLGVLRPPLPLDLLGAPAHEPVGHRGRRDRDRASGRAQHRRCTGGSQALDHAGRRRLRDSGSARDHRLRARLQRRRADEQRPLGSRTDLGEPGGRDPGRDARVHRGGDRLEPRGRGPRSGSNRATGLQGRRGSRVRDLLHAALRRAVGSARRANRRRADDAARAASRRRRLRERPDSRSRPEPRDRRGLDARRTGDLRRRARGDDSLHRDQRGSDRRLADHVLDGELSADAGDLPAASSAA